MRVVIRKPIPFYEEECPECHSVIEYTAAERSMCHIICPVCKTDFWADTIEPSRFGTEEVDDDE